MGFAVQKVVEPLCSTKVAALEDSMQTLKQVLGSQVLGGQYRKTVEQSIERIQKALASVSLTDASLAQLVLEAKRSGGEFLAVGWRDTDNSVENHAAIIVTGRRVDECINACRELVEQEPQTEVLQPSSN